MTTMKISVLGAGASIYGASEIEERHRHRYEVNTGYRDALEKGGLVFSGMSPDDMLPEIVERPDHPAGLPVFVSSSFSKSFSLYGERVGATSIVTRSKEEAARVLSQVKRLVRTNYSNPPIHGAQIVAAVLTTPALRAMWEEELAAMRTRIKQMRRALQDKLVAAGVKQDVSFITRQKGMFSYSGLNAAQMQRLRSEFGIYGVDSGRICVAALNTGNLKAVAAAIKAVM